MTRASTQAPTLEEISGQTERVLGLALRATDSGSKTHAAQRPPGVLQATSGAGPPPAPSDGSIASEPLEVNR
jgi:hypothetical protein